MCIKAIFWLVQEEKVIMKRIKFEVIVTDNGVTITDRDRLFYNFAVKDGEMTDNLQCDVPKCA